MSYHRARIMLVALALGLGLAFDAEAQSNSQDFPTPITANEISGVIKARDLGDARLTTYYYALNGEQGDLFLNLVTRNFTGDIDVFTANGLRPVTKIVVYADYGEAETGRAIYLRKPEKLLLRIQGRTPNDDEAIFRLKFAGSFVAVRPEDVLAAPYLPKVTAENRTGIRVNSVGTLLRPPPKPIEPVDEKARTETDAVAKAEKTDEPKPAEPGEAKAKPEVVFSDPIKPAEGSETPSRRRPTSSRRRASVRTEAAKTEEPKPSPEAVAETDKPADEKPAAAETSPSFRTLANNRRRSSPPRKAAEPDPLGSINLVIQFKDGTTIEKRMSEVSRFSVDKGVLTVSLKNGAVSRYSIIEVARVTIE